LEIKDIEFLDNHNRENILNIKLLNHSLEKKNIAHAFLFSGTNSDGLLNIALLLSCGIFCNDGGCLRCKVCKNVLNLKHADLFLLKPSGASLSAEEFRKDFEQKINKKATNSLHRITIIQECETMTAGIADRFLKILEDPPGEDLIFILLSENLGAIRKTIKSRCQVLNWHFNSDFSSEYTFKLEEAASGTEVLLMKIISRKADIEDVLDFSSGIDEMINKLSVEMNERHKKEISFIKKSGMDEEYISRLLKDAEESHKREKKKFSNLIIAHVFDIISAYVEDIMVIMSGFGDKFLNRKNNYEVIYKNYCDNMKDNRISRFNDIQSKIALNRKSLTENINYEIALDRILAELVFA
jgi:DNA polymerase III delta prime subunit